MSGHVVFDVFSPFPNSLSAPPVHTKAERPTSISPSGSMLLLLATHVDLELLFRSSSNQPLSYCSEKRSLHPQLEKRTLLFSLDWSASCDCWRSQGSTAAQPQRPVRAACAGDFLATENTGTILAPRQMSPIAGITKNVPYAWGNFTHAQLLDFKNRNDWPWRG